MHDDFFKIIGCLRAVSVFYRTRKLDGTPTSRPSAGAVNCAGTLDGISDSLCRLSFDLEAAENAFQAGWRTKRQAFAGALWAFHIARGASGRNGEAVINRLIRTFDAAVRDPGDSMPGRAVLNETRRLIAGGPGAATRTAATALKRVLDELEVFQAAYETAHEIFSLDVGTPAGEYITLYPDLSAATVPWKALDERLREILGFLLRSAKNGGQGGPGNDPTPSWGGVATSGSSSSSGGGSGSTPP